MSEEFLIKFDYRFKKPMFYMDKMAILLMLKWVFWNKPYYKCKISLQILLYNLNINHKIIKGTSRECVAVIISR